MFLCALAACAQPYISSSATRRSSDLSGMGTTAVVLRECNGRYEIGWTGDSRAYLYSAASGSLRRLTRDHNIAGSLVAAGDRKRTRLNSSHVAVSYAVVCFETKYSA